MWADRLRRTLALLLLAASLAALGACAPRVIGQGPATQPPAAASDAFTMADGYRLPVRAWGPAEDPAAVILALHGFNDYSAFVEDAAERWAAAGIRTIAYDQRGFGETAGRGYWHGAAALISDARAVAGLLRARHPGVPLVLFGESMGGAVALSARTRGAPVDAVVLAAPAVADWEAMPVWMRASLWLGAHTVPWMTATGRGLKRVPSDNIEMLRALGRDPLVIKETRLDAVWGLTRLADRAFDAAARLPGPALVLHGAREDLIPGTAIDALLNRLPPDSAGIERRLYPQGYHMLTRDRAAPIVIGDIAHWVLDRAAAAAQDSGPTQEAAQ